MDSDVVRCRRERRACYIRLSECGFQDDGEREMADSLEDFIRRVRSDVILPISREEATRLGAVLPILARLAWDTENLQEVVPEFDVGDGTRVDYCLKLRGRNAVFIEVKRTGEPLDPHQEQLLKYAFKHGVELTVLTDGLLWWIYLPLLRGSWEERKVFAVDIRQQPPADAAARFVEFLGRDAVSSGEAVRRAQQLHTSSEKDRQIAEAFPLAWRQLCEEPDELLVEILAAKVESISGHRPDDQLVASFLSRTTQHTAVCLTSAQNRRLLCLDGDTSL